MIENVNASKNPSTGEFNDIKKYIGVASVNILAVNPNNEKLRKYGWSIPEDADEPQYVTVTERDGKPSKSARVRLLAQVQDLEEKPIVALDFWCRPEVMTNREQTKYKIIDAYGRTAWGTREELEAKKIPLCANGNEANIGTPYKLCHPGEEEIVQFLLKYLNVTPLQFFDRVKQAWLPNKNPGRVTIDNWKAVCDGNMNEIAEGLALRPDNRVKVVLGIRATDDNKAYQTFLNTGYIGNGATPDRNTGEYTTARKLIDRFFENRADAPYSFSATPVKEWKETATEVQDNSDTFDFSSTTSGEDDLPF